MGRPPKSERLDPHWDHRADTDWLDAQFDFDFAAHFEAVRRGEESDADHSALVLAWLCRDGWQGVPQWVLGEVNSGLVNVLRGRAWNAEFPLPWNPEPRPEETKEQAIELRRFLLARQVQDRLSEGYALYDAQACKQVAAQSGVDKQQVERAWREYRERFWISPRIKKSRITR